MAHQTTKTFTSFGGIDITAVFNGAPIGTLQAISYSINREKAAIYTMGSANPRAFSRGKRMIAGSLIFILFDANPLLSHFSGSRFSGDQNEWGINDSSDDITGMFEGSNDTEGSKLSTVDGKKHIEVQHSTKPTYVDQIPPFDVILSAANEYGERAEMRILGIELMNENSGFSIDDLVVEQQYTYVATGIKGWETRGEDPVPTGHNFTK